MDVSVVCTVIGVADVQCVVGQIIVVHQQSVGEVDRLLLQSSPNVEGTLLIPRFYYFFYEREPVYSLSFPANFLVVGRFGLSSLIAFFWFFSWSGIVYFAISGAQVLYRHCTKFEIYTTTKQNSVAYHCWDLIIFPV